MIPGHCVRSGADTLAKPLWIVGLADLLQDLDDEMPAAADRSVPVVLPVALDQTYDYAVPDGLVPEPGSFVLVPFGPQTRIGVVWDRAVGAPPAADGPARRRARARSPRRASQRACSNTRTTPGRANGKAAPSPRCCSQAITRELPNGGANRRKSSPKSAAPICGNAT